MVKQELLNYLKGNDDLEEPGLDATADAIIDPLEEGVKYVQI